MRRGEKDAISVRPGRIGRVHCRLGKIQRGEYICRSQPLLDIPLARRCNHVDNMKPELGRDMLQISDVMVLSHAMIRYEVKMSVLEGEFDVKFKLVTGIDEGC